MSDKKAPGYREAIRRQKLYTTQRAERLLHLERYVEGTQYDHLPDWFSEKKPLWERAPCIVYPIVKSAIDSNADLLLGEGRFPDFEFDGTEAEDPEALEKVVNDIVRQSKFEAACRELWNAAQGVGSACAIFGVRGKRLCIDTIRAAWCAPEFDIEGAVTSLEVSYPYLVLTKNKNGEDEWRCMLYRRVIDGQYDISYLQVEAREDGKPPKWTPDPKLTFQHGYGYCPVVWYAHLRGCAVVNEFDGKAIHANLTDEIRAHDFALSQRHRAALYAGDPQWTEIGVEPGFNPTSSGRRASVPASLNGRPGDAPTSSYEEATPSESKVRKKAPGTVWQYGGKNPEVKVELHTLPADALAAIDAHAKDLRAKICEALGVVFVEPESLPNESRLSGKALESFKSRQLDKVNYYRADFGDHLVAPALGMLIRIALDKKLPIKNLELLRKPTRSESWSWVSPPIELVWGEYFRPSGEEEELLIRASAEALTAGFMTRRQTVELRKGILGIRDVDQFMAELDKEREENQQSELDMAKAMKPPPGAPGAKPAAKPAAKDSSK